MKYPNYLPVEPQGPLHNIAVYEGVCGSHHGDGGDKLRGKSKHDPRNHSDSATASYGETTTTSINTLLLFKCWRGSCRMCTHAGVMLWELTLPEMNLNR